MKMGVPFFAYLQEDSLPAFYDGTASTLDSCGYISNCTVEKSVLEEFQDPNVDAATITFDKWTPPIIPRMSAFFRPTIIFRELDVTGPNDTYNMALIFHEGLHAYTRPGAPCFGSPVKWVPRSSRTLRRAGTTKLALREL